MGYSSFSDFVVHGPQTDNLLTLALRKAVNLPSDRNRDPLKCSGEKLIGLVVPQTIDNNMLIY